MYNVDYSIKLSNFPNFLNQTIQEGKTNTGDDKVKNQLYRVGSWFLRRIGVTECESMVKVFKFEKPSLFDFQIS